jgi:photosystem II stability/assembly factor-like uncharacterized protein
VTSVRTSVGPTQFVTPEFGYSVAYRTVALGATVKTTIGLFIYGGGRWRNATPPMLRTDGINTIDDVAFVDRQHGWVAAFNCAKVGIYLYGTSDGGRSWRSFGKVAYHSCGGGPTYLSFINDRHGWMEPVSPNAPEGELFGTQDGGRTWTHLASGPPVQTQGPSLPCLAPIRFVSASTGWMGRCGNGGMYATADGGRDWRRVNLRFVSSSRARFDLPWFDGSAGVVAATLGTRSSTEAAQTREIVFFDSGDSGQNWSVRSVRPLASCPLEPYVIPGLWPAAIASSRVWWIVAGRSQPTAQVTTDAGQHWRTVTAHGLPSRSCSVTSISAANATDAWAVARGAGYNTALLQTVDGGRTWRRVTLLHG